MNKLTNNILYRISYLQNNKIYIYIYIQKMININILYIFNIDIANITIKIN